jgi:hypothetical protein
MKEVCEQVYAIQEGKKELEIEWRKRRWWGCLSGSAYLLLEILRIYHSCHLIGQTQADMFGKHLRMGWDVVLLYIILLPLPLAGIEKQGLPILANIHYEILFHKERHPWDAAWVNCLICLIHSDHGMLSRNETRKRKSFNTIRHKFVFRI